jgi:hypothetical protein
VDSSALSGGAPKTSGLSSITSAPHREREQSPMKKVMQQLYSGAIKAL